MAKDFLVKLTHFLGWFLFIISLIIVIAGLIANDGDKIGYGIIVFFLITGILGFFLIRYKRGKKKNNLFKKDLLL